jgi:hypothetical protein
VVRPRENSKPGIGQEAEHTHRVLGMYDVAVSYDDESGRFDRPNVFGPSIPKLQHTSNAFSDKNR